jgi:transposase
MPNSQIEIINGRERRRRWSLDDKLRIVAESREPGASVRAVAARHDMYPNLLSTWRNLERRGRLGREAPALFVPVRLIEAALPTGVMEPSAMAAAADTIEITLPDGSRVRVGNDVSLASLRRVMTVLRG